MIDTFFSLLAEKRGEISAEVTSAKSLNNAQVKSLTDALKKAVGRNVNVTQFVDESIIGGLIIKVGSRMLDSSLCTKLQNLQLVMKGIG
jgi:F-type H+-transporting ATPase subunit delta